MIYPNAATMVYPRCDQATLFTNYFGKETRKAIENFYEEITALKGRDAVRTNVEDALDLSTDCFFHFDHGGKDKIGGFRKEIILDLDNLHELEGIHVYSWSCLSASKLGPKSVKEAGCFSYVGFKMPAMVFPLAAYFQMKQAIYYPLHLTKELEELG